jgi:hypothetical protein
LHSAARHNGIREKSCPRIEHAVPAAFMSNDRQQFR